MDSVLITGGQGRLGRELLKKFPNALAPTHDELDISISDNVLQYIISNKPNLIIHTAALTDVRKCEEDNISAWNTNVLGTENIVEASLKCDPNIYIVYVSTACVFDGTKAHNEFDVPYPKNFYALTKLTGEFVVKRINKYLIIRTNFVAKEAWPYTCAFSDRFGTYLFASDVAKGICEVINKDITGIVHIVGDRKLSMFDLAKLTTPNVESMTLNDYRGPPLTVDMSLESARWKKYTIGE